MISQLSRWCVAAAVLPAALALAQETPPPPPPEPAPADTAAAPSAPAPTLAPAAAAAEEKPSIGFRGGASAGLGLFLPGPQFAWNLFSLHAGVQVNPMFGAYLRFANSGSIGIGLGLSPTGGSVSLAASGFWLIGANAELSLGDSFFLAGGPQVGLGGWGGAAVEAGTSGGAIKEYAASGPMPGLDFKIGFATGGGGSRVKRAHGGRFVIYVDVSMLYATKVVEVNASGGTTGAAISVGFSESLSIAPTIHLGYEYR